MRPGRLDLAGGRWVPFVDSLTFVGLDLTDAAFAMELRLTPDAPGAALVSLATVTTSAAQGVRLVIATSATVSAHIAAGRLTEAPSGKELTDTIVVSIVGIRINEATMQALPFPEERGDDAKLAWDIHVTAPGGLKALWLSGTFTVIAGATQ